MKKILGYNIIGDAELKKRIDEIRSEERNRSNTFVARLLHNAECYRKLAGSNVVFAPRLPRIISETRRIQEKT